MRQNIITSIESKLKHLGCTVLLREAPSQTPCINIEDGIVVKGATLAYGDGSWCRWLLPLKVQVAGDTNDNALILLSQVVSVLNKLHDYTELSAVELESHGFDQYSHDQKPAIAFINLKISFVGGQWDI